MDHSIAKSRKRNIGLAELVDNFNKMEAREAALSAREADVTARELALAAREAGLDAPATTQPEEPRLNFKQREIAALGCDPRMAR